MKIGIDASRANYDQKTGVHWYSFNLIEELKKVAIDKSQFILYSSDNLKNELGNLPKNWGSKKLNWFPRFLWTQIRLSWEMFFNVPGVLFIPAHVLPLIHPKNSVVTIHDIAFKVFPEAYSWFSRWYLDLTTRFALKNARAIIAPSQFVKNEIGKIYQTDLKKIQVVYHGCNLKKFKIINDQKKASSILKKYKIKKSFLLYIGRVETKKNILRIIEAFQRVNKKYPDLQLVLAGNSGVGFEEITKIIFGENNIIITGRIAENDLSYLLNTAEMFVFPSIYEGFGLPVLEAMACKCPVITSKEISTEEIAGDAALLVDPKNIEEISHAILKILNDKHFKNNLIILGLKRVRDFSWKKTAEQTLKILKE